jgi:dethiobiotin synthetase
VVACALAAALRQSGVRIAAVKPLETGCAPTAQDAWALARACGEPSLADQPGFFRAQLAAAPYAVELESEQPAPITAALKEALLRVAASYEGIIVEGAGGLFVPINRGDLIADLVSSLGLPLLLVATNKLGVLSHVLAAVEAATQRSLRISAIVLNHERADDAADPSKRTNRAILAERLECPVIEFPWLATQSSVELASAASSSGLLRIALAELDNV